MHGAAVPDLLRSGGIWRTTVAGFELGYVICLMNGESMAFNEYLRGYGLRRMIKVRSTLSVCLQKHPGNSRTCCRIFKYKFVFKIMNDIEEVE